MICEIKVWYLPYHNHLPLRSSSKYVPQTFTYRAKYWIFLVEKVDEVCFIETGLNSCITLVSYNRSEYAYCLLNIACYIIGDI